MKLTILTMATEEYWPLLMATAPNRLEYCLRWDYDFHLIRMPSSEYGQRERALLSAMKGITSEDWVWFQGADVLVTNFLVRADVFCDPTLDLVISSDCNGINNDSFFVRGSRSGLGFIESVPHWNFVNDQLAMAYLLGGTNGSRVDVPHPLDPDLHVKIVNQKYFNSYPGYSKDYEMPGHPGQWKPGDFVAHLPGMENTRRLEWVAELLPQVVK